MQPVALIAVVVRRGSGVGAFGPIARLALLKGELGFRQVGSMLFRDADARTRLNAIIAGLPGETANRSR